MKRNKLVIVTAFLLVFGITAVVSAYVLSGVKWATNSAPYNDLNLSSSWKTAAWVGASQWNYVTPSPFAWYVNNQTHNNLYLGSIDGKYGTLAFTQRNTSGSTITSFYIKLDSAEVWYTGGGPPGNDLDAIGVLTHELGHGLGLSHTQWWKCLSNRPTMC